VDDGWNKGVKIKVAGGNVVKGALNSKGTDTTVVNAPEGLTVTGCKDQVVGPIIRGTYVLHSSNHDKPVYRNFEQWEVKSLSIMLYYWDGRDGLDFSGWWFGPEVGGERTWAHHPDSTADRPPPTGWKCPFDGEVDPTLVVGSSSAKEAATGPTTKPAGGKEEDRPDPGPEKVPVGQVVFRGNRWVKKPPTEPANNQKEQREAAAMIGSPTELKEKILKLKLEQEEQRRKQREGISKVRACIDQMQRATPSTFQSLQEKLRKTFENVEADLGADEAELRRDCNRAIAQGRKEAEAILEERREVAQRFIANFDAVTDAIESNDSLQEIEAQLKRLNDFGLQLFRSRGKDEMSAPHPALDTIPAVLDAVRKTLTAHKAVVTFGENMAEQGYECDSSDEDLEDYRPPEQVAAARAAARTAAQSYFDEQRKTLQKYDANGDGFLTKVEVGLFVGEEYGLQLSDSALDSIFNALCVKPLSVIHFEMDERPEADPVDCYPGVPLNAGQQLKMAIGVQREVAREQDRRKKLEDLHFEWQRSLEEASVVVGLLEPRVAACQVEAERLTEVIEELKASDVLKAVAVAAKEVAEVEAELNACYVKVNPTLSSQKVDDAQRGFFLRSADAKTLRMRAGRLTATLKRAAVAHASVRRQVAARSRMDTHLVYTQVANILENHKEDMELQLSGLDPDKGDGTMSQADVTSFLRLRWDVLSDFPEAEVAAWFAARAEYSDGAGLSRVQLLEPKRVRYKVEKAVAMTKGLSIKESSCVRRLNAGEIVELMEAPQSDEEFDVVRIRIRALRDGVDGYVTIRGNQGTNYIEPCEGE